MNQQNSAYFICIIINTVDNFTFKINNFKAYIKTNGIDFWYKLMVHVIRETPLPVFGTY